MLSCIVGTWIQHAAFNAAQQLHLIRFQDTLCHGLEDSVWSSQSVSPGFKPFHCYKVSQSTGSLLLAKGEHAANPHIQIRMLSICYTNILGCGIGMVRNRQLFMYLFSLLASPYSPEGINSPKPRGGSLYWQQVKRHREALQQHMPEARQKAYQAQLLSHAAAGNPLELSFPSWCRYSFSL